jgi:hypothetical protein
MYNMTKETLPPHICRHCGKDPSDHKVTAPPERLVCGDGSGRAWELTDDRKAWDLMRQLDDNERRREVLKRKLAKVMGEEWAQ